MSSVRQVGWVDRSWWKRLKSCRMPCTARVRQSQLAVVCWRAAWRWLKRPHEPGRVRAIEQSSPSSWCHVLMEVWHCMGDGIKEGMQAVPPVGREDQGESGGIEVLAQYGVVGGPGGITG